MLDNLISDAHDLTDIRVAEAQILKTKAVHSAVVVMYLVIITTVLFYISGDWRRAVIWLLLTSFMVGCTIVYAKIRMPDGITRDNVHQYLSGHWWITMMTGCVWGGFALFFTDIDSEMDVFIASFFLCSITLGGIMNGAVYRPAYLALASTVLIPFGTYLVLQGPLHIKLLGIGFFVFFAFGFMKSQFADQLAVDGISARISREAAQKIYEQQKAIERLQEEKLRLIALVSHDMFQPLIAQRQFIQSLYEKLDDAEQKLLLSKIEDVQSSQEQLLQQLVEHGELGTTELTADIRNVDLKRILAKASAEFEKTALDKSIALKTDFMSAMVSTDERYLERILRNFISNAIKYTPAGGQVHIWNAVKDRSIEIVISDTGVGIASENQARIFEEYVRLEETEHISGLGLGLSVTRRLAVVIDAKIELTSKVGQGTTIRLQLPIGDKHHEVKSIPLDQGDAVTSPLIMVIGGSSKDAQWHEIISLKPWRFAQADDATSAAQMMRLLKDCPDLVVLDVEANSEAITKRDIKKTRQEFGENVPIVLVSKARDVGVIWEEQLGVQMLGRGFKIAEFHQLVEENLG